MTHEPQLFQHYNIESDRSVQCVKGTEPLNDCKHIL